MPTTYCDVGTLVSPNEGLKRNYEKNGTKHMSSVGTLVSPNEGLKLFILVVGKSIVALSERL